MPWGNGYEVRRAAFTGEAVFLLTSCLLCSRVPYPVRRNLLTKALASDSYGHKADVHGPILNVRFRPKADVDSVHHIGSVWGIFLGRA
jgi:hypothetical protein